MTLSIALAKRKPELFPRDQDAIEIGELYQKGCGSIVDSVRCLLEAGHRLIEKKKRMMKHGDWLPWLAAHADELGFDERKAQRLMAAAKKYDASVVYDETKALTINRDLWGHATRGTLGTGENEWFTPAEYLALVRSVLGEIDLDPASNADAQKIVHATTFYTGEDSGLDHEWHGRVWMNPPYAQPLIADFVSKMVSECKAGHVTAAIMLTHNFTDTTWFHEAVSIADAICFTRGRVRFYKSNGEIAAPTQGQAFFYFGSDVELFAKHFQSIGFIVASLRRADVRVGQ
jgi:phage N-6-adenine-methyltransferase